MAHQRKVLGPSAARLPNHRSNHARQRAGLVAMPTERRMNAQRFQPDVARSVRRVFEIAGGRPALQALSGGLNRRL